MEYLRKLSLVEQHANCRGWVSMDGCGMGCSTRSKCMCYTVNIKEALEALWFLDECTVIQYFLMELLSFGGKYYLMEAESAHLKDRRCSGIYKKI